MYVLGLIAALFLPSSHRPPLPFLSPIFASHMVLQRDRPNTFWGWAPPGTRISVTIAGRKAGGAADTAGKWTVRISPPPVGGPYTVEIDGPQHVQLDDVLVGDVWICSGQSNMEMGIGLVKNAQLEIASANYPGMRLFMVQHKIAFSPESVPVGDWSVCTPQSVAAEGWGGFSAAAYFFGRELHRRLGVPIGLVQTCWGGTIAEAWTSKPGLRDFPEFKPAIAAVDQLATRSGETASQRLDKWFQANDPGSKGNAWAATDLDTSSWKSAEKSTRYEDNGLERFDGVVWFRREVTLPDPLPAGDGLLQLGTVDDLDATWVNGTKVGESFSYGDMRRYPVPASVLKPGRNVIAVRVLDTGGLGGLMTPQAQVLTVGGVQVPLAGGWKFAIGADLAKGGALPVTANDNPNIPTVLYNGMIAPILPLAIKGAIWYQGESNAGRAAQYQRLLPAMIADWRQNFGQPDFSFFIVQLASFSARHPQPVEDAWAELREAQTLTVKRVPKTGLALAIDVGDARDIHPKDKQTVGYRLALAAMHVAYGQDLPYSGPVFKSSRRDGHTLRLRFDHAGFGLETRGGRLAGFQVAGADRKFAWADAKIEGNEVVVSAAGVLDPMFVRYAWDTDPEATLYNGAGLPTVPFRTDK